MLGLIRGLHQALHDRSVCTWRTQSGWHSANLAASRQGDEAAIGIDGLMTLLAGTSTGTNRQLVSHFDRVPLGIQNLDRS